VKKKAKTKEVHENMDICQTLVASSLWSNQKNHSGNKWECLFCLILGDTKPAVAA